MLNIHATLISLDGKGVLFTGSSGFGKYDLALRFIMEKGAVLVADDRVNLEVYKNKLYGSAPKELEGKLEVRGLGIGEFSFKPKEKISLCVELCSKKEDVERFPLPQTIDFLGVSLTKIKLYPFECSILCKIIAKLDNVFLCQ